MADTLRLVSDEDVPGAIVRALRLRQSGLDVVRWKDQVTFLPL
jgi:hypothetical protein